MINNKSQLDKLFEYEKQWVTSLGKFFPEEKVVFHGKNLFKDLKDMHWLHLLLFGITGRFFEKNQIKLFESMWVICASYPDPRIWVNRVAALAGTARSTGIVGVGAATSVFEASIYGGGPIIGSIDFIIKLKEKLESGSDVETVIKEELKKSRGIAGYGRPIANEDERLKPILELAENLNMHTGEHVKLAFLVEEKLKIIQGPWALKMNIAALIGALAADQNLTANEFYHFMSLSSSVGIVSCFVDANNKPEGAFFPLRCERIKYEGVNKRKWDTERGKN